MCSLAERARLISPPYALVLTICYKTPRFCFQFILPHALKALALQNPAFWPAICCILARKTMGFGSQNACFQIVICCILQSSRFAMHLHMVGSKN